MHAVYEMNNTVAILFSNLNNILKISINVCKKLMQIITILEYIKQDTLTEYYYPKTSLLNMNECLH